MTRPLERWPPFAAASASTSTGASASSSRACCPQLPAPRIGGERRVDQVDGSADADPADSRVAQGRPLQASLKKGR